MKATAFWYLVPDNALPAIIMVLVVGAIIGLVSGRAALGVILSIVLLPVIAPLLDSMMATLPPWLSMVIVVAVVFTIGRGLLACVVGQRAADHLTADLVRFIISTCFVIPFRILGWVLRWGGSQRNSAKTDVHYRNHEQVKRAPIKRNSHADPAKR